MNARQEQLLTLLIETYIKTAEPIGSRFLVDKAGLDWSEATVRNELRELEDGGYLTHPHTSAGRVPTAKGYEHYLRALNLEKVREPNVSESELLAHAFRAYTDFEHAMKNVAKKLVEVTDEAVLVAFGPDKVYYTGLSNLIQKPDFSELKQIASVSEAFDRCEECLPTFYDKVGEEPQVYIGSEHPFGKDLSVVASRLPNERESLIVIIGPQRMNYKKNWSLVQKLIDII